MKRVEAEKLLGGYATGTLTETERTALFTAALEHQAIFDALMDEEALRELLADPTAKAQVLAALAPVKSPKAIPFWRRPGLLGAAASVLMATLAGLVYLRNPEKQPLPLKREAPKAAPVQAQELPLEAPKPPEAARKVKPEAPSPSPLSPPAPAAAAQAVVEGVASQAPPALREVQDQAKQEMARKALPSRMDRGSGGVPGGVPGGAPGGVVGGVVGGVAGSMAAPPAPSPVAATQVEKTSVAEVQAPTWKLEPASGGASQVTVLAPRNAHLALLRRNDSGVEALSLKRQEASGDLVPWRVLVRLAPGDVLDLYLLNHPVPDPARLPETGAVDGFRARIHPLK